MGSSTLTVRGKTRILNRKFSLTNEYILILVPASISSFSASIKGKRSNQLINSVQIASEKAMQSSLVIGKHVFTDCFLLLLFDDEDDTGSEASTHGLLWKHRL